MTTPGIILLLSATSNSMIVLLILSKRWFKVSCRIYKHDSYLGNSDCLIYMYILLYCNTSHLFAGQELECYDAQEENVQPPVPLVFCSARLVRLFCFRRHVRQRSAGLTHGKREFSVLVGLGQPKVSKFGGDLPNVNVVPFRIISVSC